MSTTIHEIAGRLVAEFDVIEEAAFATAQTYWQPIRYLDDNLAVRPDAPESGQMVSDEDADSIVESTRRQLQAEGLL